MGNMKTPENKSRAADERRTISQDATTRHNAGDGDLNLPDNRQDASAQREIRTIMGRSAGTLRTEYSLSEKLASIIEALKRKVGKYEHADRLRSMVGDLANTHGTRTTSRLPQVEKHEIERALEQCRLIESAIDRNLPEHYLMEMIAASVTALSR